MSDAAALIAAILGRPDETDAARQVLDAALERETDPLLYCTTALGIDPTLVMERAAVWAGLMYLPRVPRELDGGHIRPDRLEALADVRTIRVKRDGQDYLFASPDFLGLLGLKRAAAARPQLASLVCLLPEAAFRSYVAAAAADALVVHAHQNLAKYWPYAVAHLQLTTPARYGFFVGLTLLLVLALSAPFLAQVWLLPLTLFLLVGPAVIRLAAVLTPATVDRPVVRPADEELPIYSVLIPLRNEAVMVPQLYRVMSRLDYPSDRLDIKFVVESASPQTVAAVRQLPADPRFSLVVVPEAKPHTKPKALNYALPLCRGQFVVVYDAEDLPDPDQLWRAAVRFRDTPDLACLQARLVIDNGRQNWLAGLFAGEYAGLFTVLLPALSRWGIPMPLGGTSNHFRLDMLRALGGWDSSNVTEDADVGMRLARRRMRVETLVSATRETAPDRLVPWHGQRTRWMKGWMQTFIVHNSDPRRLRAEMGLPAMLAFEVLVLGMITAPILHIGFSVFLSVHLLRGSLVFDGTGWSVFYLGVLIVGYGSAFAMTALGLARLRRLDLLATQFFLPVYWLLIAAATVRAVRELVLDPFYWFKSPHEPLARRSLDSRRFQKRAQEREAVSH